MKKLFSRSRLCSSRLFSFLILLLLLLFSACAPQAQDQAQPTGGESNQTDQGEVMDSPVPPADTAQPNTPIPSLGATATPLPTPTATPGPYAMITGNTNCRTGPGSVYDLLHTYLAGKQVDLLGKSPDGFFWYTSDQEEIAPDCWLWGQYATPVGDTAFLPVFTPPPTPTPSPDFEVAWVESEGAAGSLWLYLEIENIGPVTWESALLFLHEPTVPQDAGRFSNKFQETVYGELPTKDNIPPGESGYFVSGRLGAPGNWGKIGDVVDFYFTACTEDNLGGTCITKMWTESVW